MDKNNKQVDSGKFDNHINVIDATGNHLNPSYLHRAKGLVKNGRAEWVDEKTIRIIAAPVQDNAQTFLEYLTESGEKQTYIDQCTVLFAQWEAMNSSNAPTVKIIAMFLDNVWHKGILGDGVKAGLGAEKSTYRFLDDYAEFMGESSLFAGAYREHIRQVFEEPARNAVNGYKKAIVFIPEDTKIDPYFLDGLTNHEFVIAFRALQQLVYGIYEEIERTSPFEWGWQGWQDKIAVGGSCGGYGVWHNRIMGLLGAFADAGHLDGDVLVVDKKKFVHHDAVKNLKKARTNMITASFMDMGLSIEGFDDKKAGTFTVSCLDTPHLIMVLFSYCKKRPQRDCCKCVEDGPCHEDCSLMSVDHHHHIFSYRFVEAHSQQTNDMEVFFLAVTDSAPEALREIQFYLHEEAAKYGFAITPPTTYQGSIQYMKHGKAKPWLLVGSGTSRTDFFYAQQTNKWTLKTEFKRIFKKHPDKADELAKMFPEDFRGEGMFTLQNPTLDDVKAVLEIFKLEHNIKA